MRGNHTVRPPFGRLATEIDRIGAPVWANIRDWEWRDLMLEATYNEEDADKYRQMRGCTPWAVPRGVWSGG